MSRPRPTDEHDSAPRRPWLLGGVVCFCVLVVASLIVVGFLLHGDSGPDVEYTQAQLLKETLGTAHDELIMLIISLAVVIEVVVNFGFIRRIPRRFPLLCSFGFLVLSVFFTVTESFLFPEVLNYLEHLSFMTAAILLAVWCWCVFGAKKQEGS